MASAASISVLEMLLSLSASNTANSAARPLGKDWVKLMTGSGTVAPGRVAIFSSTTTEEASKWKMSVPTKPTNSDAQTPEDAAARILQSAEGLLAFADKEEAKKAEDAILSIMTACGFHDLVGQRVTKITETLDAVIATRLKGAGGKARAGTAPRQPKTGAIVLDGPAFPGDTHAQARIDALFDS